jgi:hypothetical protein
METNTEINPKYAHKPEYPTAIKELPKEWPA